MEDRELVLAADASRIVGERDTDRDSGLCPTDDVYIVGTPNDGRELGVSPLVRRRDVEALAGRVDGRFDAQRPSRDGRCDG